MGQDGMRDYTLRRVFFLIQRGRKFVKFAQVFKTWAKFLKKRPRY